MTTPVHASDDAGMISTMTPPAAQALSGVLLLVCALLALGWANSPWAPHYHALWHLPIGSTTLLHAVNDGLMALFFLMVGLEITHEVQGGALSTMRQAALPVVGAIGGMVVPALVYVAVARDSDALRGWGIPMATDIAFALGIVALLRDRVPTGLRIFLAALAIADDIGAVLVIALFYTPSVNAVALGATALLVGLLLFLNTKRVHALWPYLLGGLLLWGAVYASGIHASIAGVLLAFTIPARQPAAGGAPSVQHRMEAGLHWPVTYLIVPVFAFANAGVTFPGNVAGFASQPAVLATALGLMLGKPLGITGAAWLAVRAGWAALPEGTDWPRLIGVAALGGIGFTMSLFIAALAFGEGALLDAAKVGVLAGSLIAGSGGALLLFARHTKAATESVPVGA
ncbi:Na+/H+ antiporter NhaA [Gemmatimonas sp.]|uniref:Na+/H+ antiporter NhaA n=1 Tax=Gemmatimonas sp. TaxID=1962908 RepID=UPI00286CC32C|nr:Na+/H+ antiporter NhaA [Gemmatimonas sp.]